MMEDELDENLEGAPEVPGTGLEAGTAEAEGARQAAPSQVEDISEEPAHEVDSSSDEVGFEMDDPSEDAGSEMDARSNGVGSEEMGSADAVSIEPVSLKPASIEPTPTEAAADAELAADAEAAAFLEEWVEAPAPASGGQGLKPSPLGLSLEGHDDPLAAFPFLVDEFLIWLWFRSERDFSTFVMDGGEQVELWFDDRLAFRALEENQAAATFKGGAPSTLPEAKLSLLSGRRVQEARLGMRTGEAEWNFSLKASGGDLLLSGVKIPSVVKDGFEERVYERMALLDRVTEVLAGLFTAFFRIRVHGVWAEEEAPAIETWLLGEGD